MGSRTYYRTEDCLDNGYERAFREVYARKGGEQPFLGTAACLKHPKAMTWNRKGLSPDEVDEKGHYRKVYSV